jgi:hypothetical protein
MHSAGDIIKYWQYRIRLKRVMCLPVSPAIASSKGRLLLLFFPYGDTCEYFLLLLSFSHSEDVLKISIYLLKAEGRGKKR